MINIIMNPGFINRILIIHWIHLSWNIPLYPHEESSKPQQTGVVFLSQESMDSIKDCSTKNEKPQTNPWI